MVLLGLPSTFALLLKESFWFSFCSQFHFYNLFFLKYVIHWHSTVVGKSSKAIRKEKLSNRQKRSLVSLRSAVTESSWSSSLTESSTRASLIGSSLGSSVTGSSWRSSMIESSLGSPVIGSSWRPSLIGSSWRSAVAGSLWGSFLGTSVIGPSLSSSVARSSSGSSASWSSLESCLGSSVIASSLWSLVIWFSLISSIRRTSLESWDVSSVLSPFFLVYQTMYDASFAFQVYLWFEFSNNAGMGFSAERTVTNSFTRYYSVHFFIVFLISCWSDLFIRIFFKWSTTLVSTYIYFTCWWWWPLDDDHEHADYRSWRLVR